MILLCYIWIWHGLIGYRCSWILRDSDDADFSWIIEVYLGMVVVSVGESEGHSPNMDLRGYFS